MVPREEGMPVGGEEEDPSLGRPTQACARLHGFTYYPTAVLPVTRSPSSL